MYTILEFARPGDLLRFTYAAPALDDTEWRHCCPADPVVRWYEELKELRAEKLNPDRVIDVVLKLAAAEHMPAAAVDWLGLSLYAAEMNCQAAARLTPDAADQESFAAARSLSSVLSEIAERFDWATHERLHPSPDAA
ncbi:MAG: hypothetical protein HYS13_18385 [Planctomycetia bacterium]|nr:hypothetical protein [Planctomycetia bacterium]